jgi:glycerol-3-phosphate acyltransferase PlsY
MIRRYGLVLIHFIEKYSIPIGVDTGNGLIHTSFDTVLMEALSKNGGIWLALAMLFCAAFGYIVGSINFAVVISKMFFHDDVRTHGSGNAGATNMLRTYGRAAGISTFILDGVKGAVAVLVSMLLMGEGGMFVGGLFCILGHIFPVFYKFRGGKGVVVSAVTILCLNPTVFLCLVVMFVLIVAASKYISLGSVICAFFFPMLQAAFTTTDGFLSTTISVLIAAIVIIMHHSNIKRLINRTENKLSFKKKEQ